MIISDSLFSCLFIKFVSSSLLYAFPCCRHRKIYLKKNNRLPSRRKNMNYSTTSAKLYYIHRALESYTLKIESIIIYPWLLQLKNEIT